jgi:riboflavin synthase
LTFGLDRELARLLLPKGSVAVDGVSLTVDGGPFADRFTVNLIPQTLRWTRLGELKVGAQVNLEMDVLVKAARSGEVTTALAGAGDQEPGRKAARSRPMEMKDLLSRGFRRRHRT